MQNRPADPVIGNPDTSATPVTGTAGGQTAAIATSAAQSADKSKAGDEKSVTRKAKEAAAEARNETMEVAHAAKEQARNAASKAAETARTSAERLSSRVESAAGSAVDSALSRVHEQVDERKHQASGYVGAVGRAFQAAGDSLQRDGMGFAANYVHAAANGLEQAADEVEGFNTNALTGNVERYVRGNPMLTVAGLALAGFALANIVGSSRRR